MEKLKNILFYLVLGALFLSVYNYFEMRSLYCDLQKSVIAEREYTYPILRTIANPVEIGKDIKNPITTKSKYNTCK